MNHYDTRKALVVELLREVWSQGKLDAAASYVAPIYTIHHDPGDPWDGKQLDLAGYQDRVARSRAPFPDQRFDIQALFADGDAVVVTWLWSGTHTGSLPGFPASGQTISTSGATVYYFTDDRISGHWQVTDRLAVFQQLRQAAPQP